MRPRVAALVLALALPGCDVAVGVGLALSGRDGGSSSRSAAVPPVDTTYHVWIAQIPDAAAASAQEAALLAADGTPDPLVWKEVGTAVQTAVFDPTDAPGTFNAILVQAGDAQAYHLDAIEVLGAAGNVVLESASGPTYSGQAGAAGNATGTPDGLTADLAAGAGTRAFLFTLYATAIDRFRVNAFGTARASGDVAWAATWSDGGDETTGGAALDSAGTTYVAVYDAAGGGNRDLLLLRIDTTGTPVLPATVVQAGVSAAAGSASVAVHADDTVYVAGTVGAGDVLVRRYAAGLGSNVWSLTVDSGVGIDRAESNSIAVDSAGNAVVAAGMATALNGIDPWMRKFAAANGATLWTQTPPLLPADSASTYWHAAGVDTADDVYSAGDLTSTASGFVEIVTRRSAGAGGGAVWSDLLGDNQAPADLGRAVGTDLAGNAYVAGFMGTGAQGRNGVLLKYLPGGLLATLLTYDDLNAMDDEALDLAVEPDGTVYAAGYETVAGQGENWWVRRYDPAGGVVWTRAYDGGVSNDRATSVSVQGNHVIVVGTRTEAGGETNVHVRRYVK